MEWFNNGGKEFLAIDLRKDQGRKDAVKFLNLEEEWKQFEAKHKGKNTKLPKIFFDFYVMLIENNPPKLWKFSPVELWHRIMAIITVLVCSGIDHSNALVTLYTLDEHSFVFDKKMNSNKKITTITLLNKVHKELTEGNDLLDTHIHVQVHALKSPDVDLVKLASAFRHKSETISYGKTTSSRPSPWISIANFIHGELQSITEESIEQRAVFNEGERSPISPAYNQQKAEKEYNSNNNSITDSWGGIPSVLDDDIVRDYNRRPFDHDVRNRMKNHLTRQSNNEDSTVAPPFPLDYDSFSKEPGQVTSTSWGPTSMVYNAYWFVAPLAHFLQGGIENVNECDITETDKLINIISFTQRFHLGAQSMFQSNLQASATMQYYDLKYKSQKYINDKDIEDGFIGTLVALVSMINSCLAFAGSRTSLSAEIKLKELNEVADLLSGAIKSIDGAQNKPFFKCTMLHLGEIEFYFF